MMRRALQAAGRAGFALGVTGVVVGLAAAPAFAASASLSVTPTGTVDHNVVIKATGSYDNSTGTTTQTVKLSVARPDSSSAVLYSGSARPLSSGATPSESVDTSALNLNGDYVFTFSVGSTSTTKSVTMKVPPAKVGGFAGSASGTVAHFTWAPNSEPDLAGYDLIDVTDSSNPRDLTPGGVGTSVCDASGCAVDIDFGSAAAGTSRSFVIDALRYTSPAHSAQISSGDSAPVAVAFPAPAPPPSSAPGDSGGSSSGGTTTNTGGSAGGTSSSGTTSTGSHSSGGSSSSGTSTAGGSDARTGGKSGRTISAGHPSVALKAYLPSLSAGAAPSLPSVVTEVKPLPQGTYKPTLAYPDQVVSEAVHHDTKGVAAVRSEIVRVLNVEAVWKSLAGAVLILLVAAHLRAWVAGVELDS